MSRTKEVGTAIGTLACALGIGFAMQSTDSATQRYGVSAAQVPVKPNDHARPRVLDDSSSTPAITVRSITLTSALPTRGLTVLETPFQSDTRPAFQNRRTSAHPAIVKIAETDACPVTAQAATREAALVRLTLDAVCRPNEIVTVTHSGMAFSALTDANGSLSVTVPALAKAAVFVFTFEDGDGTVAFSTVSDLEAYHRVVLQWRGTTGFELHAREFGADYGADGHVWHGTSTQLSRMSQGEGGVFTSLGHRSTSDPMIAEVYSIPSNFPQKEGSIDLSIEALVNEKNCGSEVKAQTFELNGVSELRRRNLSLAMPTCDTVGDYLVLNNVLDRLTVTAN